MRIYGNKSYFPKEKILFFTGKVERINVTFEISKVLKKFRCYILKVALVGAKSSYKKNENVPVLPEADFHMYYLLLSKREKGYAWLQRMVRLILSLIS